jgi:resolvase-like protein
MEDVLTTEYDGCGRCLVAVRRLSRKTDKTSSPQRQADQDLQAAADAGGHIIAWADDWEVSGATDPMTRKGLGPWLRGEMGPYDGIVAPTVDRVGRNVRDTLNTQELLTSQDRVVVTADHVGVWDFSDPNQENEWLAKAWGSQMELRAIQKRNPAGPGCDDANVARMCAYYLGAGEQDGDRVGQQCGGLGRCGREAVDARCPGPQFPRLV